MPFNVQAGSGEFGSFGIVCADAKAAVTMAHDLMARGVVGVRIVDGAGRRVAPEVLSRDVFGHSLSADQLALIQQTSDVLVSGDERLAEVFYDKLFETAPSVRPLFPPDMTAQRRKLLDTLISLLQLASQPGEFKQTIEALGARHVKYGALPEHYGPVGHALVHALGICLGERLDDETKVAWTILYLDIAAAMSRD